MLAPLPRKKKPASCTCFGLWHAGQLSQEKGGNKQACILGRVLRGPMPRPGGKPWEASRGFCSPSFHPDKTLTALRMVAATELVTPQFLSSLAQRQQARHCAKTPELPWPLSSLGQRPGLQPHLACGPCWTVFTVRPHEEAWAQCHSVFTGEGAGSPRVPGSPGC